MTPASLQPPLSCPVCCAPLVRRDRTFECPNGHSFDVAKEGYVNLLASRRAGRGVTGDVAEMVRARRSFLEAGYFDPLREQLASTVGELLGAGAAASPPPTVLEVGSGDGYYIGGIAEHLHGREVVFLGMDVSKDAARVAAKRHPDALFFVADINRRICVQASAVRVLLDVFAPRNPAEFERVVEPGGSALVVIPTPAHLASVRKAFGLLEVEEDKERRVVERFSGLFDVIGRTELAYSLNLTSDAVRDVIAMGPNYWHERMPHEPGAMTTDASFLTLHLRQKA